MGFTITHRLEREYNSGKFWVLSSEALYYKTLQRLQYDQITKSEIFLHFPFNLYLDDQV